MTCVEHERLAAAASGEDALAVAHAATCARCGGALAEQRAMARALGTIARDAAPMRADARRALKGAVLAAAMATPVRTTHAARGRRVVIATLAVAAIAAGWFVVRGPTRRRDDGDASMRGSSSAAAVEHPSIGAPRVTPLAPVPPASPVRALGAAEFEIDRDVVHVREGAIAVEAPADHAPVEIVGDNGHVAISGGTAEVHTLHGVVVSVRVFAGAATIDVGGQRAQIIAGELWTAPPPAAGAITATDAPSTRAPTPPPTTTAALPRPAPRGDAGPRAASMANFRDGWIALREERFADALHAFDRATDDAVREDAAFWAAIAMQRAGSSSGAITRFTRFVADFPASPRVGAAHLELADLLAATDPIAARAHLAAAAADPDPRVSAAARARLADAP